MIISPLKGPGAETQPRSLRQAVASINNEKDLNEFVASHHLKMAPKTGEVKYERNPVSCTFLSYPVRISNKY